jgi:hypothetical protein
MRMTVVYENMRTVRVQRPEGRKGRGEEEGEKEEKSVGDQERRQNDRTGGWEKKIEDRMIGGQGDRKTGG